MAISVTKPVAFVQTKFFTQYPTARGVLGKWEIYSRSVQKRRNSSWKGRGGSDRWKKEEENLFRNAHTRWEGDVEVKEKRRSEMEDDPPITVALVFSTIQSRRELTSPKRNLNLEAETRCTIFAPKIFTKLFNDEER